MKQKYSVLAVALILLVVFSLIVFIVPIHKTNVFWLSYCFAVVAMVAQLGFVYVAFAGGASLKSRFYGFPIFRIGMIYMVVQIALSLGFMLLATLIRVALWVPSLLYLVVLALAAIGLIAADNVRDSIYLVEQKQAANTAMMRALCRNADVLARRYPELEAVAESLHYADPVSTAASVPYEQQMENLLRQISQADEAGRGVLKNQLLELLEQRNAVCKASKR